MSHKLIRTAVVALSLTALGAPAAVARESGQSWTPPRDMRSPDARDAAEGRGTFNSPDVVVVGGGRQRPAPVASDSGIDWTDAGIGAGAIGGLVLLAGGGALVAQRRHATAA